MVAAGIEYGYPVSGITTAYEVEHPFLVHTLKGAHSPSVKLLLQKGDVVHGQKAMLTGGAVLRVAESESSPAFIIPFKFTNGYMVQQLSKPYSNATGSGKSFVYYDYKNGKKYIIKKGSIGITDISVIELKDKGKKTPTSIGITDISVIERANRRNFRNDTGRSVKIGSEWVKKTTSVLFNLALLTVGLSLIGVGVLTFYSEAKEFSKKV